ncbi:MAG: SH3 domain-containing protein [Peptostreptococcus sp.]|uniref:C40 family peptidase n=1 Tax=Peptostreptococcus sp. TaxID=1262 RepID=UPI002FCA36A5
MNKAITVLGLSAAAVAISVSNASAMEQQATEATTTINHKDAQENATSNKVSELPTSNAVTGNNIKTVTATETNTTREATSVNTNSTSNNVSAFPKQETNNVKTTNGSANAVAVNEEATASEEVNKIDENVNNNNTNKDVNTANENKNVNAEATNENTDKNVNAEATNVNADKNVTDTNEDKNADATTNIKTDAAATTDDASDKKTPQTTTATNLREEADVTSGKVMELKAGEKLTVLERKNGWTKVQTENGQIGWISGYYVAGDEEAKKENETVKTEDKASTEDVLNNNKTDQRDKEANGKVTSTDFLNVRVGPSVSNGVSGVIYRGEIFKVLEKDPNGWVKVMLNDGTTGWANGKYIDMTVTEDKTNIDDYNKQQEQNKQNSNQGKVNSSVGLRVRSGAGTNTSVITTLNHNSVVNIIGEENGWYKVKLENGQTGYVGAGYVTKTTPSNPNNNNNNNGSGNIKEDGQDTNKNPDKTPDKNPGSNTTAAGQKVVDTATSLLGVKYSWGGTTTAGFDCSGFTQYVYKNALGVNIPRVSRDQANAGSAVSMSNAKAGDLLYFDTMGGGRTSHVGIYLGDGKFIHASGSASNPEYVKISSLSERWVKCLGARRFA